MKIAEITSVPRGCALARSASAEEYGQMDNRRRLKTQLPFPYNQDFTGVVCRLNRVTPGAKERLAIR